MKTAIQLQPYCFESGQSGNPNGRPKGSKDSLAATCRRLGKSRTYKEVLAAAKERGIDLENESNNEALSHLLWRKALEGDLDATKILAKLDDEVVPAGGGGGTQKTIINIHGVSSNGNGKREPGITINGLPLKEQHGNGSH